MHFSFRAFARREVRATPGRVNRGPSWIRENYAYAHWRQTAAFNEIINKHTKLRNRDARRTLQAVNLEGNFSAAWCAAESSAAPAMRQGSRPGPSVHAGASERRFVTGSGLGAPQDRGVAAPRSGGYGGSYDSCGGAKRMEKLARRVAVAVSRHAQQDCDGGRMEVEDGAAHPGSGAVVGNDNGAISCYGAGEASCQDWAPRRWAPGRRRVAAQTGSRELWR